MPCLCLLTFQRPHYDRADPLIISISQKKALRPSPKSGPAGKGGVRREGHSVPALTALDDSAWFWVETRSRSGKHYCHPEEEGSRADGLEGPGAPISGSATGGFRPRRKTVLASSEPN